MTRNKIDESVSESTESSRKSTFLRFRLATSDQSDLIANDRVETLKKLMTVQKNPSTIFSPPFGTNVEEHHSRLGEHARQLWEYNKITDLTVKLRGIQYPCHKTVLSCYSKYFKDLLLNARGTVNTIHLRLPSVSNGAFGALLTHMYTSELSLTCQNIGEVYAAARKLGMDEAVALCQRVLTGQSKHDVHSVYVYVTAKKQNLRECAAKALKIMTRRFEQIVGTPEFLDLDFLQVKEYLNQNVLATRSEVIVYLAALKWLNVKFLEREQYATELICGCVRFQMMTLNEILASFSPPMLPGILEIKAVRDSLLEATCYVAATSVNEERRFERYACKSRTYLLPRETVILWDPSIFDPERHAIYQEEMAATTIQAAYRGYRVRKGFREDKAAAVIQTFMKGSLSKLKNFTRVDALDFSKAGKDETRIRGVHSDTNTFSRYSNIRKSVMGFFKGSEEERNQPSRKTREKRRNVAAGRRSSSIDTLVGHIEKLAESTDLKKYASNTAVDISSEVFYTSFSQPLETVHKIYTRPVSKDGAKQEKEMSPSSSSGEAESTRSKLGCHVVVTGGFRTDSLTNDLDGKAILLFDSAKEQWNKFGSMEKARHHHCLVHLNGEIYFIGGCDPGKTKFGQMIPLRGCYKLKLASRKWSKIARMHHCRMYHGVAELRGRIYVIGGKDERDRILKSVEVYNPSLNKWEEKHPLQTPTMGSGVCAHHGKIWVAGGVVQDDSGNIQVIDDVQWFDPERERWNTCVTWLPQPRAFVSAVSFKECVYIIGGTTQTGKSSGHSLTTVSDVFHYDDKEEQWTTVASLPLPRHFVQTSVVGDILYVLGGLTSFQKDAADNVFFYDKKNRKWNGTAPIPLPLCGFASVSVPEDYLQ